MLENTQPNDSYTFSLTDFSCVENVVKFNFPESNRVYLNIFGREFNQTWNDVGFALNLHYKGDNHTTIKGGYYSWMDRYETNLTVFYPDHGLVYKNIGTVPDPALAWPNKSDFSVTNASVDNFSTSANVPYVYQYSIWQYIGSPGNAVSWYISNPSSGHIFKELPEELVSQYPELAFENMKLVNTTFYTEAGPYEDYVEKNISNAKEPTPQSVGIIINP